MTIRFSIALARALCVCTVIAVATAASLAAGAEALPEPALHFANADDPTRVAAGRLIYTQRCSSCHGKRLQGQPLWQLQDEYSGRRAPAHDESGHTWEHSDEDLFHITRYGRFTATPPN